MSCRIRVEVVGQSSRSELEVRAEHEKKEREGFDV
jgi:hypothetical protein